MKFLPLVLAASAAFTAVPSSAATITVGSISRVEGSATAFDSLNNRTWLGLDRTTNLTYEQAVASTLAGGKFAGFKLARNADAQKYVNAFGDATCTVSGSGDCLYGSMNIGTIFGENWTTRNSAVDYNYGLFLSDNGTGKEIGQVVDLTIHFLGGTNLSKDNEWGSIAEASSNAGNGTFPRMGWLMYRAEGPENSVPEPGTLAIFGLGLAAVAVARRRRAI